MNIDNSQLFLTRNSKRKADRMNLLRAQVQNDIIQKAIELRNSQIQLRAQTTELVKQPENDIRYTEFINSLNNKKFSDVKQVVPEVASSVPLIEGDKKENNVLSKNVRLNANIQINYCFFIKLK